MFNELPRIYPLLSLAFLLTLGLVVYSRNIKGILNCLFLLVSLVFSIWQLGTFMMFISATDNNIIFWDRVIYLGVVFMPAFQYHFALAFTYSNAIRKYLLFLAYILSGLFLIASRTDFFVADVFRYKWGVHTIAQPLHHFFLAFFFFYIFLLLFIFLKQLVHAKTNQEKYRLKYLIVAFAILNLIGGLGYLPAYKVSIYPISLVAPVIFSALISYTILKHRLLDIKLVARRYAVFTASLVTILIPAFFIQYLAKQFFSDTALYIIDIVLIAVAVSLFPPLRKYYYDFANTYLFSSLYDTKKVIRDLSDKLRSTIDIEAIYRHISQVLLNAFHSKGIAILLYDEKKKKFLLAYRDNLDKCSSEVALSQTLMRFLQKTDMPFLIEETNKSIAKQDFSYFTSCGAALINPLNIKDRTIGLMLLTDKESGDSYNEEDLQVLNVVGSQAAIAIENALSYEEIKKFNITLQKKIADATTKLKLQNEELQKLDKMKSEFISIASHQLRTPLTATKWALEFLAKGDKSKLTKKEQETVADLHASNSRLIKLVNELLNVSRLEESRVQIDPKPTDVVALVKGIVHEFMPIAQKMNQKIIEKYDKIPKINLDENIISKAIHNFVSNGIKYNREGKTLTITIKKRAKDILMTIADEGIGIPKSEQTNIFKKFFRASNAAASHTEGTGLGMYIAKSSIELSGGKVGFQSEEGKGTTVFVTLPLEGSKTVEGEKGLA